MNFPKLNIIGVMSGTSLDGIDLALVEFYFENNIIKFNLIDAKTVPYSNLWVEQLQSAYQASAQEYFKLHHQFGLLISQEIKSFTQHTSIPIHYIASHGHTIFHQPQLGFTTQMGCGATIAANTGISTICDFRSVDVAMGGQGAPLVPIGDRDLFAEHEACLNIGGIANISYTKQEKTSAFDICYANMVLNFLCHQLHLTYDDGGKIAQSGNVNEKLLQQLLGIQTHRQSLGRELFEEQIAPMLKASPISIEDKLSTCTEYTAHQIAQILHSENLQSVLITGGGAYNHYLIKRLTQLYKGKIHIPEKTIIEFKEAIIFAYLGYLRVNQLTNTLQSVTLASANSIGGCIYFGNNVSKING